jgi:methionyl-tRNA formyltransferase
MRILFMGSPDFALPTLRKLIESEHEIVAVYTQPDRPVGRGRKLAPPPVKTFAIEHELPVHQPPSISKPDVVEELRRLAPDVGVIAAYGQILKQSVLDVPRLGVLNVHASLLPRWRGAAPVPAAILAGDGETGATIMLVSLQLDSGPVLDAVRIRTEADDTAATLTEKIARAGADLLLDVLPKYTSGSMTPREQDESQVTFAPSLKKGDALIDWSRDDAETVSRKVRAYNPWPVAFTYLNGEPLRILECVPLAHRFDDDPGTIYALTGVGEPNLFGAGFGVICAKGEVGVVAVQPPGGKRMLAADYMRGHREIIGKRLRATPNRDN